MSTKNHQRQTKKIVLPKAGTTSSKTICSHWASWKNTDEHQREQWKTMKGIQTALNKIWYSPLNIKKQFTN